MDMLGIIAQDITITAYDLIMSAQEACRWQDKQRIKFAYDEIKFYLTVLQESLVEIASKTGASELPETLCNSVTKLLIVSGQLQVKLCLTSASGSLRGR